jgi:hypothetical protein
LSSDARGFATAVTCIDGRVHGPLVDWVKARFDAEFVDLLTQPGADLALCCEEDVDVDHLRAHLAISVAAHHPGALVITGHADCAANPVSDDEHRAQVRRAVRRAGRWAPAGLPVIGAWVDADGRVEEVGGTEADDDRLHAHAGNPA